MIGIYIIKNNVNGKIYIGKSIDIEKRWKEHIKEAYNPNSYGYNTLLNKAIRKYGEDNFQCFILEDNLSEEDFVIIPVENFELFLGNWLYLNKSLIK